MRTGWILTAVMMAALVLAPKSWAQQSSGVVPSSRTDFGTLCGIGDTAPQSAMRFARSTAGKWMLAEPEKHSELGKDMAARAWHEKNWMVDLHDAPAGHPELIHTGQFCFDPQGHITRMIDRYMDLANCRCMRFTSLTFSPDGTVKQREVDYVDALSGERIQEPAAAKGLPEIWQYRRLEQLPFYSLLKK